MDDVVLYEVSDGIAKITLNRPDQMNAWTGALSDELQARLCLLYTSDAADE